MRVTQRMNIKGAALGILAAFGLLTLAAIPAQTASAHYVYQSADLYTSSQDCVWGYSETSHGTGKGYSKSEIRVKYNYNGSSCAQSFTRPSGYIKVRHIYQTHLTPGWTNCRDTGWIYNSSTASSLTVARTHNSTCGSTWEARTNSGMFELNGTWKGGDSLYSGNHALPF
jgi:hypothetical protein